jgi:hypothetical protein
MPEKKPRDRRAYRQATKAHRLAYNKAWKVANPEKVREQTRRRQRKPVGLAETARTRQRRRAMHPNAVVPWADKGAIAQFYALAVSLTASSMTRTTWHVDHIVPLRSELVCGLHTHNNLQVVTASANIRKSSKHWPDMP